MERKLLIVIAMAALSTSACSKLSQGVSGNSSSPGSTSTATVAPGDNPREDLIKWMGGQLNAKSFRARVNSSGSTEGDRAWLAEFVAPDRYHITIEAANSNGSAKGIEMIRIGPKIYVRSADRPWQEQPAEASRFMSEMQGPNMLEELRKSIDIKFIGRETLDGIPMLVYRYNLAGEKPSEPGVETGTMVWVAATDGLPRKTESDSDFAGRQRKLTSIFYDYNADIRIEPPM